MSNQQPRKTLSLRVPRPSRRGLRRQERIRALYARLKRAYGAQNWWPASSRLEVVVGAYLTQNTSWSNVERALTSLKRKRQLSLAALRRVSQEELAMAIRSAGYFSQKAHRIKLFVKYLTDHHRDLLSRMFRKRGLQHALKLRHQLLSLHGVGPETADSILLYAGDYPVFVVDAYARRVFARHRIFPKKAEYDLIRESVQEALAVAPMALPKSSGLGHAPSPVSTAKRTPAAQHLNEFHALIVQVGKQHCHKSKPDCAGCPLRSLLPGKN